MGPTKRLPPPDQPRAASTPNIGLATRAAFVRPFAHSTDSKFSEGGDISAGTNGLKPPRG